MRKLVTLLLVTVLTVSSLVMVGSVFAQSNTNPSVPDFTLRYVDYSYDIPPVYGVDEYTGETVIKHYGDHVDKRTVEIKITNQPFKPYNDEENHTINLYYNVQVRGHFGGCWKILYGDNAHYRIQDYNSQYTIINYTYAYNRREIPRNGEMDFQVQASIGYESASRNPSTGWMDPYYFYNIVGEKSDWSDIQTISIPDGAVSKSSGSSSPATTPTPTPEQTPTPTPEQTPNLKPTPTPSQEPLQTEFTTIIGITTVTALVAAGLGLLIFLLKRK
jgi:hypothetical protein